MSQNIFNKIKGIQLGQADEADLKNHLDTVKKKLGFAVGLSLEERQNLSTISRGNKLFVEDIADAVEAHPALLPGYISQGDWEAAWNLYNQMEELEMSAKDLTQRLRHTKIMAGALLYKDARSVYQNLQEAYHRGMPGVEPYFHRTTKRFEGQRLNGLTPTTPDANMEDDNDADVPGPGNVAA